MRSVNTTPTQEETMSAAVPAPHARLAKLAHVITRHRWPVIAVWIVLTLFGGVAAGKLSNRWYQTFSVPGKPAYEASERSLKALGVGVRPPKIGRAHVELQS